MKFDDLDAKMRVFEQSLDQIIPPGNYIVARIDGRSFTRLTKEVCKFEAPFDERFNKMMVETVKGLVADTGMEIIYGYTQSDEISLLFAPGTNVFGRKVRKLNSVLAGSASSLFSLKLGQLAVFDSRIGLLPWEGNYILIELPIRQRTQMGNIDMIEEVQWLVKEGYTPVLAHPVRYLWAGYEDYDALHRAGAVFRRNFGSLEGAYGKESAQRAEALLRWGYYGFLGTDTHNRRYTDIFDNMLKKGKIRQNESTIRI